MKVIFQNKTALIVKTEALLVVENVNGGLQSAHLWGPSDTDFFRGPPTRLRGPQLSLGGPLLSAHVWAPSDKLILWGPPMWLKGNQGQKHDF